MTQQRKIRSFVRREGRMTAAQKKALEGLYDKYGVERPESSRSVISMGVLFGNNHPVTLEIGFGNGDALLQIAQAQPENNFIGIEVHRPGMGRLLANLERFQLSNVRVICADAVEVLEQCIADSALARVNIYFPDPWPKKRHHKRRLINASFIDLLAKKITERGGLHIATDWQDYAEFALSLLNECSQFCNQDANGGFVPRPTARPLTHFEQRGERLGHGVWDLLFYKPSNPCNGS